MKTQELISGILYEWLRFGVLMVILHVLFVLIWIGMEAASLVSTTSNIIFTGCYVVITSVTGIQFYFRLQDADEPPEYRYAREHGIPMDAEVLSIERTKWYSSYQRGFRKVRRWEYAMRVRIISDGQDGYEANTAAYIHNENVPRKGDMVAVTVHPDKAEVVVFVPPKKKKRD